MKQLTKQFALSASALAAALMITACGGGASTDDTTAPTVTITDSVADTTATGNVTFTFTFSESVGSSFIVDDITVTGGDKSTFTMADTGLSATLVVVPTANATGTISVAVAADKFKDAANVVNTASATATQAYNTVTEGTALNFETGGKGAAFTWKTFENATNPAVEIVANPNTTGINSSTKVAKFTTLATGAPYAGFESKHGTDFGTVKLSAANALVKIMVYKTVISDVGIKFANAEGGSTGEIKVPNTKINEWEELTFDFSGVIGGVNDAIDQIIFMPDFKARSADNIIYIDNITFSAKSSVVAAAPATAAPTPTKASADVISLFSNAYSNVAVDTWRTSWSAATLTDVQIAGNDTKKYAGLDFVGIEAMGAKAINASAMTHVNFDVWTSDATTFRLKLVDIGAAQTEGEVAITPTLGAWKTVKLPLSDYASLAGKANISQLIFSAVPIGGATVFVDNLYFSKEEIVAAAAPTTAAPTPTKASADVISLFSNAYTNVAVDTWRTSWSAAALTDVQIAGNDTKKYSALDFVGIEAMGAKAINASAMTHVNFDVWTSDATTFRLKLVDFGAAQTEGEVAITPTLGAWKTVKLPLSDYAGLAGKANISQIIFSASPVGSASVFIDNIYFSK
jgi:hypothetical protein